MKKFFAIVKCEYKKVVLTWAFLLGTFAAPLFAVFVGVVPMLLFSIQGEPKRIAIVEQSGAVAARIRNNLSPEKVNEKAQRAMQESFKDVNPAQQEKMRRGAEQIGALFLFEDLKPDGKSPEQIRSELNERILSRNLDAYLIVPENIGAPETKVFFYARNAGDFVANSTLEDAVNEAIRAERLSRANIDEAKLQALSKKVDFEVSKVSEKGEQKDSGSSFVISFAIGFMIYITLAIYGQAIMGAVVEEKETRIAEILFSSAKPFQLMLGKLVGVGLAGLTQLVIWLGSGVALLLFGLSQLSSMGFSLTAPNITPLAILFFVVFFLLGFFLFATIFALIGSMVTTVQEGSQFAFLPVTILLITLYCIFPVARDPNSNFAVWTSMAPFVASMVMPVRISLETPPLWQILVSILVNFAAVAGMVWVAAKVYRTGMLMYGKRATIPEVWKWIRQS
jgi:ABC-2 type transport system permease protein